MKLIPTILVLALLSGCSTTRNVVKVGDNLYTVKSSISKSLSGRTKVKTNAIDRACDYCKQQFGKKTLVKQVRGISQIGAPVQTAEATFRCFSEGEKWWQGKIEDTPPTINQEPVSAGYP